MAIEVAIQEKKAMHAARSFSVSTLILVAAVSVSGQTPAGQTPAAPPSGAQPGGQRSGGPAAPPMTLTVSGFPDGGQIPVKFSQAAEGVAPGEGLSPAITWTNVPAGTQSFVLNMRDLDVARNKTTEDQAHWVVWNIAASTTNLPEGVP